MRHREAEDWAAGGQNPGFKSRKPGFKVCALFWSKEKRQWAATLRPQTALPR